jgi:hypothetical protein
MTGNSKHFVFNTLVDRENLCNLTHESKVLAASLKNSDKLVIYGRRDSGKTSLIRNVVIPDWRKKNPKGMALYAEFYGVRSLTDISERLTVYFNKAYANAFKIQTKIKSASDLLKGIRPNLSFSQDGTIEVNFRTHGGANRIDTKVLMENLAAIHQSGTPVALFLDEFQDIALVANAEETLREELQNLPFEIPIVILGSKQHLLAKIFQKPRAPFFNWGKRLELGPLPVEEFNDYILDRFAIHGVKADRDVITNLQKVLLYNAEAINMFCSEIIYGIDHLEGSGKQKRPKLTHENLFTLLYKYVESMVGEFEIYLSQYTDHERRVLTYVAKSSILKNPTGKEALNKINISANGMRKIILKFMDNADIYQEKDGYVLSKPLLMIYLKKWKTD